MASISRFCFPTGRTASPIRRPSRLASSLLRFVLFVLFVLFFIFAALALAFERRSENVAQGGAGIRRAILGDRLFLLGDFQRLDRDRHAPRAAIKLRNTRVYLFADSETVGPLLGTIARQFGALDEGGVFGAGDADVDAAFLDLDDFAGNYGALLQIAGCRLRRRRVFRELLDAERDAL